MTQEKQAKNQLPMIDYIPAQVRTGKRMYIDYYAFHPGEEKLKRKQIRVGRIQPLSERKKFAKRLVQRINLKLAEGWNPFVEQETPRALHRFSDATEEFFIDKSKLRPDTLRSYRSCADIFLKWLEDHFKSKEVMIINFSWLHATKFLEDQYRRGISNSRYNNILGWQKTFFNWMVEHHYTKVNPFEKIKKKRKELKKRIQDIDPVLRKKIRDYLTKKNPMYWCVCMLAFHSLLRPKEISYIKVKYVDLESQTVFVPGKIAKNGNDRYATIPDVMIDDVKKILKSAKKKNDYLFSKYFLPGPTRWDSRETARYWAQLRPVIDLPKELQFYSLRDAGIIQKLRDGLDPAVVMSLADHSSLEMTNKYVKIARQKANQEAKTKSTAF